VESGMTKPRHQDQFEGAHFAMSADTVADALDISVTTLNQLVEKGLIPKPFPIPGHPRLIRWDPEDVRKAVRDWKEQANPGTDKGWDDVR
jgi:predicted DNA-binding transcriptional regulator AlpA